jgi:hypothetical protein
MMMKKKERKWRRKLRRGWMRKGRKYEESEGG